MGDEGEQVVVNPEGRNPANVDHGEPLVQVAAPPFQGNIPPPPKLELKGDLAHNWKRWRQIWDSFEVMTRINQGNQGFRLAAFITYVGPEALDIYNGLPFETPEDAQNMDTVLTLMQKHCLGETNVIYERYIFNNRMQLDGESIDTYANHLRTLAASCNFNTLQDELIRDRIVCGIRDTGTRRKLLQESKLTLKKCINICRATETTSAQMKAMSKEEIHAVQRHVPKYKQKTKSQSSKFQKKDTDETSTDKRLKYKCKYCGGKHPPQRDKCPAYGQKCHNCGNTSHFAAMCKLRKKGKVHAVDGEYYSNSEEELLTIDTEESINCVIDAYPTKIFANLEIDSKLVKFQVDSGATCNIISRNDLPSSTKVQPNHVNLRMYNGTKLEAVGTATVHLRNPKNSKRYRGTFIVVPEERVPLIGSKSAQQMNFIKVLQENLFSATEENSNPEPPVLHTTPPLSREAVLEEFKDVFMDTPGTLQGSQKLEIDPDVTPVRQPLRRIPHALKKDLKRELTNLEELGVIVPVDTPTDWVSSLLVVKKPSGRLRICIDPKPLNKALKRCHYPLPVMEDILPEIAEAKVFSKCDLKDGFWHVVLDEDSSYLTTFGTPFGRYRWLRLPFGVSPAPEIFQQRLDQALQDLPGTSRVADDILIIGEGSTKELAIANHDERFIKLMRRCREKGIHLNAGKLELKCSEVSYIGHQLTADGLKPDPSKVRAILQMPKPVDVKGVQRVIGMVNYLSKFMKGLSDLCEPLRQLTKKGNAWNWDHPQDEAFEAIQRAVTQTPVLKYFNSSEDVTLQCDASDTGLGATLLQGGQPVAYASRALTLTERNYAQIEKELLSILFGFTRFNQYLYGRQVSVESDHKPLETIHKKPLVTAPKRLQRMLLALQNRSTRMTTQ